MSFSNNPHTNERNHKKFSRINLIKCKLKLETFKSFIAALSATDKFEISHHRRRIKSHFTQVPLQTSDYIGIIAYE